MTQLFSYKTLQKRKVACPICDGQEFETLASRDRYHMGLSTAGCKTCGLVMTNPMPSSDAMGEFYSFHYRRYYHKVDIPTLEHIQAYELDRRAAYTVDYLSQFGLLADCKRMLDVGCGEGSILKEVKHRCHGIHLVGIEPGREFSKFARQHAGCIIYTCLSELNGEPDSVFDLIVVNHVLEHVENPVQFLITLKQILSNEGKIYLDVPDVSAYSDVTDLHIAHLYHFSMGTLTAATAKAGLHVVAAERHCPPRHPRSIRCVLGVRRSSDGPSFSSKQLDDANIHDLIRSINGRARLYFVRQRIIGRLLGAARRLLHKVFNGA
jgi:2-polyprenyl-3-methyl-5-hydroxy-6-metoxy-1,4-benzoquinol methylase